MNRSIMIPIQIGPDVYSVDFPYTYPKPQFYPIAVDLEAPETFINFRQSLNAPEPQTISNNSQVILSTSAASAPAASAGPPTSQQSSAPKTSVVRSRVISAPAAPQPASRRFSPPPSQSSAASGVSAVPRTPIPPTPILLSQSVAFAAPAQLAAPPGTDVPLSFTEGQQSEIARRIAELNQREAASQQSAARRTPVPKPSTPGASLIPRTPIPLSQSVAFAAPAPLAAPPGTDVPLSFTEREQSEIARRIAEFNQKEAASQLKPSTPPATQAASVTGASPVPRTPIPLSQSKAFAAPSPLAAPPGTEVPISFTEREQSEIARRIAEFNQKEAASRQSAVPKPSTPPATQADSVTGASPVPRASTIAPKTFTASSEAKEQPDRIEDDLLQKLKEKTEVLQKTRDDKQTLSDDYELLVKQKRNSKDLQENKSLDEKLKVLRQKINALTLLDIKQDLAYEEAQRAYLSYIDDKAYKKSPINQNDK
jgi:hypothetical protein